MKSSCSLAWIVKRLRKARAFEVQKLLWKIFLQNPRAQKCFNESEDKGCEEFELLRYLRRVSVCCMASELKDRRTFLIYFNDVITRHSKDLTTGQKQAKQCILKSKIFARTLKILHIFHTSASVQRAALIKTSLRVVKGVQNKANGHQTLRHPKRREKNPPSSSTSQRYEKPSVLDSVFVSSLSSRGRRNTKQSKNTISKNRLGQRTRRQLAEKAYGSAAKHLKKGNRHPHSHSDTRKSRKAIVHPPKKSQASHTHKTTPTKQLHPSWEASKKKKEMNKLLAPQGKRTVFTDSD